jgi:hypothetical protein
MSVGSWEPDAAGELSPAVLEELLRAAARAAEDDFGLDRAAIGRLAGVARDEGGRWAQAIRDLDAAALEALARFFTLAEARLPGFEAGGRSPVIALARELRRRGAMTPELGAWIKANTDNRFLPYGSLLDRL